MRRTLLGQLFAVPAKLASISSILELPRVRLARYELCTVFLPSGLELMVGLLLAGQSDKSVRSSPVHGLSRWILPKQIGAVNLCIMFGEATLMSVLFCLPYCWKAGSAASVVGSVECAPCAAGSFAGAPGSVACSLCGPGQYQEQGGQAQCLACPVRALELGCVCFG